MGNINEIAERELVQQALKKALDWLGELENDTVKPMFYGGQGIIFRMESKKYPYPLSIKVPLFDDKMSARRYRRAILKDWALQSVGAKADHTIFPELVACDAEGNYLIRQYLEGNTLHHAIFYASPEERLDLFLKLTELTRKVFDAYHEGSEEKYILRDYREPNIFIEDRTGRMYVIDCGSAYPEKQEIPENYEKWQKGLGQDGFISWSPERLLDWREMVDRRADFYSYGVMAYNVLFGHQVYHNSQTEEVEVWKEFYQQYREAEARIRQDERLKTIPAELVEQLIGCLHPDPHKRFVGRIVTP